MTAACGAARLRIGFLVIIFILRILLQLFLRFLHPCQHTEAIGTAGALVGTNSAVRVADDDLVFGGDIDVSAVGIGDFTVCKW